MKRPLSWFNQVWRRFLHQARLREVAPPEVPTGQQDHVRGISSSIGHSTGLTAVKIPGPNSSGVLIRHSSDDGTSAVIDADAGQVTFQHRGRPPQHEDNVMHVCARLLTVLNARGESWTDLRLVGGEAGERESGADCEARSGEKGSRALLRIQVTRAAQTATHWRDLSRGGSDGQLTSDEMARGIWAAIENKRLKMPSRPEAGRLVLVLDAIATGGLAVPDVVEAFRSRYGEQLLLLPFDVWLIGPIEQFTYCLWRAE